MKVLLLNASDIQGGAARSAYRLHQGLRQIGIDSRMLVQRKYSDDAAVLPPSGKSAKLLGMFRAQIDTLPLQFYRARRKSVFSPAMLPDDIAGRVAKLVPDVVNLHWVGGGFMRVETMRLLKAPLVWTLHDMWAFTGGCHYVGPCERYQGDCGACPQLGSDNVDDLSRRIWRRKAKAWNGVGLTVVTPSRWLADCARSSALFRDRRVEVIPYGLDLDRFKPIDKVVARSILSLPQNKRLILFGAMSSTSDERKGFPHLVAAMRALAAHDAPTGTELVVFGASRPSTPPDLGFPIHYLGHLHDDISLALVYAAADLFVAPSTEDNLPNTVLEATACGTPTVAFDIGGMPDLVEPGRTGYLAKPFDDEELASGVRRMLADPEALTRFSRNARFKAEREFPLELQARRYASLYGELRDRTTRAAG